MYYLHYSSKKEVRRLSKDEVIEIVPSVVTVEPHNSLSQRYSSISTLDIMDIFLMDGWYPVKAEEVHARKSNTEGYQKHLIHFQHDDLKMTGENIEAILTNSHDGKSRYNFLLGIFRLICSNGLMVGDIFDKLSLRHVGLEQEMVTNASRKMISFVPQLASSVEDMKKIELSPEEKNIYGESAAMIVFPKVEDKKDIPVTADQLLRVRRNSDYGKNDLWTTFNMAQENIMKGGLRFNNPETKKRQSTRKIKAIDKSVSLNRALWNLTEEMKKLKMAA